MIDVQVFRLTVLNKNDNLEKKKSLGIDVKWKLWTEDIPSVRV